MEIIFVDSSSARITPPCLFNYLQHLFMLHTGLGEQRIEISAARVADDNLWKKSGQIAASPLSHSREPET